MTKLQIFGSLAIIAGLVWAIGVILQRAMSVGSIIAVAALLGGGFVALCVQDDKDGVWDD